MAEINNIQNDNGLVRILRGKTTSAEELPKKNEDDLPQFSVTINPSKTTTKELQTQLARLRIKDFISQDYLEGIAGTNKTFDENELPALDEYLDKEVALWELQKSGIKVDGGIINNLTSKKAKDPDYINILKDLQKSGIKVDGGIIYYLSLEKAKDRDYINALKDLQRSGIKVDGKIYYSPEKFVLPIIYYLSLEKAKDRDYINALKDLQESGIKVDYEVIVYLSPEKARDKDYLSLLKKSVGDFGKVDKGYILMRTGKDIDLIKDNIKALSKLYLTDYKNDASEQIITKLLRNKLLPFVENMNRLHESSDAERLKVIQDLSAGELFQLIVFANEEVYTSTFRLIFDRMLEQMGKEKTDAYALINQNDPLLKNYRVVLTTCASYGRLNDFLSTIKDPEKANELLSKFVTDLPSSKNKIQDAVSIAELMSYETNPATLSTLERLLIRAYQGSLLKAYQNAYKNTEDQDMQKLYSIMGSIYYAKKGKVQVEDGLSTFQGFAKKYPIKSVMTISQKELINPNNEIVEQQRFYNDKDGEESFALLMGIYRSDPSWKIDDKNTYVVFSKTVNDIKMSIYANKPENEGEGVMDINLAFEEKGLRSIIFVHRGHSYHVESSIEKVPSIARIVYLGSCGGFNNISAVLKKAPQAQIISTKGRGSGAVNDPLLKNISEAALQPVLDWKLVWDKTENQTHGIFRNDFQSYVPPYKNIAAQLINAYGNK